ncbi:MAG TPA: hypothetical protein VJT32_03220 [bacterium]|nr:hypothetical protein [bacterium]
MAMFAVANFFETIGIGHFLAFTPLFLRLLGVSAAALPRLVGVLGMIPFTLGLPLVPF